MITSNNKILSSTTGETDEDYASYESDSEIDSDDDDDGGWITPSNIKGLKHRRGLEDVECEESSKIPVVCVTGDFSMQVRWHSLKNQKPLVVFSEIFRLGSYLREKYVSFRFILIFFLSPTNILDFNFFFLFNFSMFMNAIVFKGLLFWIFVIYSNR